LRWNTPANIGGRCGIYWRGQFEELLLVNPQHIKGLADRKADPKDAQ
jgi:hypothetical protein